MVLVSSEKLSSSLNMFPSLFVLMIPSCSCPLALLPLVTLASQVASHQHLPSLPSLPRGREEWSALARPPHSSFHVPMTGDRRARSGSGGRMDGRMDGRTEGRTEGRTGSPGYRELRDAVLYPTGRSTEPREARNNFLPSTGERSLKA